MSAAFQNSPLVPVQSLLAAQRVLVVGDVMLDRYWMGSVDRISPEAPVPVVRITSERERLGGAANVALNVKVLGAQTTLLTVVGNDEPARRLRELLEAEGIRCKLGQDDRLRTIVKLRVIGKSQQLLRIDFENAPDHEILTQLLDDFEQELPRHDVVLLSDYGKGGLTHVAEMIALARQAGKPVLVDPKGSDYSRYAGASLITPNRLELSQVVGPWQGEPQLNEMAQSLRQSLGIESLLLTRSEEGMTLFQDGSARSIKAEAREVFDVTGAGDTVIAVMAVLLAARVPPDEAMVHANRAGGLVAGKFGTANVTYEELFGGR